MAEVMPEHPMLTGGYAPIQMECDVADLVVEGEIPLSLNGIFIGMDQIRSTRLGNYHWFAGDGMIHAFRIENAVYLIKIDG